MSRYTTLYKTPENLYTENSPVVISAGALLKDNDTNKILVQLKFRNIYDKTIKAVKIEIIPYSVDKEELAERKETQYLDLTASYNTEFGQKQPVFLADNTARSFDIICKSVVFADHSKWENISNTPFISADYPQGIRTKINVTENFSQFIDFATKENIKDNTNIFWQKHNKEKITSQKNELSALLTYTTGELYIKTNELISNYHSILSAERKADEDFSEDELKLLSSFDELKELLDKSKTEYVKVTSEKQKRIVKLICSFVTVCITLTLLIIFVFIPSVKYNSAIKLMNDGKYNEAIVAFSEMGNYRQTETYIKESHYLYAVDFFNTEKYEDALARFSYLNDYKDSKQWIEKCNTMLYEEKYKTALDYFNQNINNFKSKVYFCDAIDLFKECNNYKDSNQYINYINAKYYENISIIKAYNYYINISLDFLDTADRLELINKYKIYSGIYTSNKSYEYYDVEIIIDQNDDIKISLYSGSAGDKLEKSNNPSYDYMFKNINYISKDELLINNGKTINIYKKEIPRNN